MLIGFTGLFFFSNFFYSLHIVIVVNFKHAYCIVIASRKRNFLKKSIAPYPGYFATPPQNTGTHKLTKFKNRAKENREWPNSISHLYGLSHSNYSINPFVIASFLVFCAPLFLVVVLFRFCSAISNTFHIIL